MTCNHSNEATCGCCEGTQILTPMPTANRPGLDALAYRVGIHATFLETMKARLSNLRLPDGGYPLQKLTTRAADDPSIALLDAWATVADVLTFYQERIANEGYLPTATERRSILELANLIGYKLRPGVAASTFLAFTLEDDHEVEIPAGTRAQSLPGPGELPQPFETSEPLFAHADWNAMQPRLSQPQILDASATTVNLAGLQSTLKPDDPVLLVVEDAGKAIPFFRSIHEVEMIAALDRTDIRLRGDLALDRLSTAVNTTVLYPGHQIAPPTGLSAAVEDNIATLTWTASDDISGAAIYTVRYGLNRDNMENLVADIEGESVELPPLAFGQTYFWQVTARDHLGAAESVQASFATTTPAAAIPTASAADVSLHPTLFWPRQGNETSYIVTFGPEDPPPVVESSLATTSYTPAVSLAPDTTYFWSVRVAGSNNVVVAKRSFTTKNETVPAALAEDIALTPTLYWPDRGAGVRYFVRLGKSTATPAKVAESHDQNSFTPTAPLDPGARYFWSVAVSEEDADGNITEGEVIVAKRSFVTANPFLPREPRPIHYTSVVELAPNLRWQGSQGVTYTVAFGLDPDELSPESAMLSVPEHRLLGLESGRHYYWRVTTYDASGNEIAVGPLWEFTTAGYTATDQSRINAANALITNIRTRFDGESATALLRRLGDPNLSASVLEQYIEMEEPALVRASVIFGYWSGLSYDHPATDDSTSVNFASLKSWIDALQRELTSVKLQLPLRRLVPETTDRLFPNVFIDPTGITLLTDHLEDAHRDNGNIVDEITLEAQGTDRTAIGQAELTLLIETELESVLLPDLNNTNLSQDERIAAIQAQSYRVDDLFVVYNNLSTGAEVIDWTSILLNLLREDLLSTEIGGAIEATRAFSNFLSQLQAPPALQPVSALRLERDLGDIFGTNADMITRLITTFQPELQDTFYQAWGQFNMESLPPLQSLNVMGVKAAPLGARAALMPVFDDEGVITGHREWPLLGFGVKIIFDLIHQFASDTNPQHYHRPIWLEFSLTEAGETRQAATLRLTAQETSRTIDVDGLPVTVAVTLAPSFGDSEIRIAVDNVNVLRITANRSSTHNITLYPDRADSYSETLATTRDLLRTAEMDDSLVSIDSRFADNSAPVLSVQGIPLAVPLAWRNLLTLDAQYDKITPGTWVVLTWSEGERTGEGDENPLITRVEKAEIVSKPNAGKVTQLTLNKAWIADADRSFSLVRRTTVYAQSDPLNLAGQPVADVVEGTAITLDGLYPGLTAGRWLIISGERVDIPGTSGVYASELAMIGSVKHIIQQLTLSDGTTRDIPGDTPHTQIVLAGDGLAHRYKRTTVKIYGNVVKATHGETRNEVLGSGEGRKARQSFTLKQAPLTHVAAPSVSGTQSTLNVRVNNILWHEADNLVFLDANDRGYVTQTEDDDKTTVIFGDGKHGARLPTGIENIKAVYRSGIGKTGNVDANKISLLAAKPLGVKEVINPLAATGGADRERRDQARKNAPLALMALDRLVSLTDYADFTRTYAGIGKASATRLIHRRRELIHVTIAGADDIPIATTSDLYMGLCQSLHTFGTLNLAVQIDVRELLLILISARVRLLPDYAWEFVEPAIRAALLDAFRFERRDLAQHVRLSAVINTIQAVAGVAYVDVDILDAINEETPPEELEKLAEVLTTASKPRERIIIQPARIQTHHIVERPIETLNSVAARYEGITATQLARWNNLTIHFDQKLASGTSLTLNTSLIRPAQLAYLSPDLPDLLILKEVTA